MKGENLENVSLKNHEFTSYNVGSYLGWKITLISLKTIIFIVEKKMKICAFKVQTQFYDFFSDFWNNFYDLFTYYSLMVKLNLGEDF